MSEPVAGARVVVALDEDAGLDVADRLRDAGADVRLVVSATAPADAAVDALRGPEVAEP